MDPEAARGRASDRDVHDPWLVRRLTRLFAEIGFDGADPPATVAWKSTPSMIGVGAGALAAHGTITPQTADALKAEARHRAAAGRFFGHIGYASVLATRRD